LSEEYRVYLVRTTSIEHMEEEFIDEFLCSLQKEQMEE
jgi:hypothetical protein